MNLKIVEDNRLSAIHIALYNALFLIWNDCGFETELSINRNDVMKLSKIGSANTYTKSLKELHEFGYIYYKPSHNPLIGSRINLYRFDNSSDNTTNNTTNNSSDNSTDNGRDTLSKPLKHNKTIKTKLLSSLTASDVENQDYLLIAKSFIDLFKKNISEVGGTLKHLENAKGSCYEDIRLMVETDNIEISKFREVYNFLQKDQFWKKNIQSTKKLREKFNALLLNSKNQKNGRNPEISAERIIEIATTRSKWEWE